MTGICYFSNKSTDYFAEMQVKAIAELDDSIALREEGDFSPEKADKLLAEAIEKDCNKIVFLTEDANVSELSRLIPQEYGQYFEDIQVVAENFYHINEAATAAPATNANGNASVQQGQPAQTEPPKQVKGVGDKVVIICDAAAPYVEGLSMFVKDKANYEQQAKQGTLNGISLNGTPTVECWLCNVDSAGLAASNVRRLYENHPNDAIKKAFQNIDFKKEGFNSNIEALVTMAATSETVKNQFKYYFIVPSNKVVQANTESVSVLPLNTPTYENKNNQKILSYIQDLKANADSGKTKKRNDIETDESKYMEGFKKNEANIKFIVEYIKAVQWWEKNKDKRIKQSTAEDEFVKEILKVIGQDFVNIYNKMKAGDDAWGGNFSKSIANTVSGLHKAFKDDEKVQKDTEEKKERAESPDQKLFKAIYEYEHYKDLCNLLGLKC